MSATNEGKMKTHSFKLDEELMVKLDKLTEHYQQGSIVKVNKSDVLRHLISEKYEELYSK